MFNGTVTPEMSWSIRLHEEVDTRVSYNKMFI